MHILPFRFCMKQSCSYCAKSSFNKRVFSSWFILRERERERGIYESKSAGFSWICSICVVLPQSGLRNFVGSKFHPKWITFWYGYYVDWLEVNPKSCHVLATLKLSQWWRHYDNVIFLPYWSHPLPL